MQAAAYWRVSIVDSRGDGDPLKISRPGGSTKFLVS
jgi:hypothetical protein